MPRVIVLAMHGMPPSDFPQHEAAEFFGLHARLEHAQGPERAALERRHADLDGKMRAWPRTPRNDPFAAGSEELATHLQRITGADVIVGYNEFCAPDLDSALDAAAARGTGEVVVITPMMTRGGAHSEVDIPAAIQRARQRHPRAAFRYVWPLDVGTVARFLASQVPTQ